VQEAAIAVEATPAMTVCAAMISTQDATAAWERATIFVQEVGA
jgi:hypothetical protein